MKLRAIAVALALGVALPIAAAPGGVKPEKSDQRTERGRLVYEIVKTWAPHVQELYKVPMAQWARGMAPTFASMPIATLQQAANAEDFHTMSRALMTTGVSTASGDISPAAFGDIARDLVYVPITPCRILDTRAAIGPIAADTVRGVDVTATSTYAFQGGSATDCGGLGTAGSFAAVAINFTSVAPAETGFFTAYPLGVARPLAATQVFFAGDVRSNLAVVQLDQGASANEMNIYSERTLHLVGDVVGYFITSPATALQCQETAEATVTVAANGTANAFAPVCATGYTQTATNCTSTSWLVPFVFFRNGTCSARNNSAVPEDISASRTCCRVPGRL